MTYTQVFLGVTIQPSWKNKKTMPTKKRKSSKKLTVRKRNKTNHKRSNCRRSGHRKRGGAPQDGKIPLSAADIEYLKQWTMEEYRGHPRLDEVLGQIHLIKFDPEYTSAFDGSTFTGEHKVRWQAMDKIQDFFKYPPPVGTPAFT